MARKFATKGGNKGAGKTRPTSKPTITKQQHTKASTPPAKQAKGQGKSQGRGQAKSQGKGQAKGQAKGQGKSQGKSQGKGHGKAARESEQAKPASKGERKRIGGGRVTGKMVSWKGSFGFIVPDAPIKHPSAKPGGKLYTDQTDIEAELDGVGARVSFFVYCDDRGLGAAHVVPAKEGVPVKQTIQKAKAAKGKGSGKDTSAAEEKKNNKKNKVKGAEAGEGKAKTKGKGEGKAKAKGKGKGKKDGAKAGDEEKVHQPPDKSARESFDDAGNGTIVDWRGNVGWLKPDEPLEHPDARQFGRRKGLLFVHVSDCEGDAPLTGAQVMYTMFKDTHGLGAENVQVLVQGDGVRPPKPAAEDGQKAGEEGAPRKRKRARKDKNKQQKELKKVLQKSSLLKSKAKGKGKGNKPAGEKGPSGPDLPRERVSEEAVTGEVVSWRGRVGWIKPSEAIDHPDAAKHGGKLWAHINDLSDADTKMERGMTVQCFLFKDASGLGAEGITPL